MTTDSINPSAASNWVVYIIECSDDSLYTGISNDFQRRWRQHCGELKNGAKFFRGRKPQRLRFIEENHNRSSALQREHQIKQLSRQQKNNLIIKAPCISLKYNTYTESNSRPQ